MLFYGVYLVLVFSIASKLSGVDLALHNLPLKGVLAISGSIVSSLLLNLWLLKAISMISVGKSTLVYSSNPIFSVLLSAVLLSEHISKIWIFAIFGALLGVYFLSMNKMSSSEDEDNILIGIALSLIAAFCQSWVFVSIRIVNIYKVHTLVRPFYTGVGYLLFIGGTMAIYRNGITIETYDEIDIIYFSIVGVGCCIWVGSLSLAMKYESAAKLSPVLYLENIITLISDVTLFDYEFSITDYIGISIIMLCLLIPSFYRIYEEQNNRQLKS